MASTNDTSTTKNDLAVTKAAKRKSSRKFSGGPSNAKNPAVARRPVPRTIAPSVEILFTEEPNPAKTPIPPYVWIDYPTEDAQLEGPTYVVRLGVGGADAVEISIDQSPWLPCRFASGYWWYDWAHVAPGEHTLVSRIRTSDNRWFKTPARRCRRNAQ